MNKTEWVRCPVCGGKTRNKVREDSRVYHFPLYCPKCRTERLVDICNFKIKVIKEPDAETQSR